MMHNALQCLKSDKAISNFFMAVFVALERILAVIYMDRLQAFQSDNPIKFFQYAVQILYDIISRIVHMTRIEADTNLILQFHPLYDSCKFLNAASDLCSFSRHRLKQHRRLLLRPQNFIQSLRDLLDSFFHALSDVAARMKIVDIARQIFHPL